MATVADNDVEEASPVAVTTDKLSGKPAAEGGTGSSENNPSNCKEMQVIPSKSVAGEILQVQQTNCIVQSITSETLGRVTMSVKSQSSPQAIVVKCSNVEVIDVIAGYKTKHIYACIMEASDTNVDILKLNLGSTRVLLILRERNIRQMFND